MTLLTVKEIAELLRISERKVYELVSNNEIPHVKVGGSIRFNSEVINKWLSGGDNGEAEISPN